MKLGLAVTAVVAAFALSACGSSGAKLTSSQQAAQASFGAGQMGQQAPQNLLAQLADRIATGTGSGTISCPKGGSVSVGLAFDTSGGSASVGLKLTFNGCVTGSYTDPKTQKTSNVTTDGTLTYSIDTSTLPSGASVAFVLNGHLDFSGGIDDSVDIQNVKYGISTSTTNGSTAVAISLSGKIVTGSGHTFDYSGTESYTFDGTITASANP